jgi:hypothetical protein
MYNHPSNTLPSKVSSHNPPGVSPDTYNWRNIAYSTFCKESVWEQAEKRDCKTLHCKGKKTWKATSSQFQLFQWVSSAEARFIEELKGVREQNEKRAVCWILFQFFIVRERGAYFEQ